MRASSDSTMKITFTEADGRITDRHMAAREAQYLRGQLPVTLTPIPGDDFLRCAYVTFDQKTPKKG